MSVRRRESGGNRLFQLVWTVPMIVWQLAFFVGPMIFLVIVSFWSVKNFRLEPDLHLDNWRTTFGRSSFWEIYARTWFLSATATIVTSLAAFPAAYHLAYDVRPETRRLVLLLLAIPFFSNYVVRIYAWEVLLSDTGVLNALFGYVGLGPYDMLNTRFGTIVGFVTLTLPLVVILQVSSLVNVPRDLIEAAWNLRCRPLNSIWRVVIPAARPGLVIAALFCFIMSFGDFVSPTYLGGGGAPTLSILIVDTTKSGQQWPRAAVIALVAIATLLTVAVASVRFAYRKTQN